MNAVERCVTEQRSPINGQVTRWMESRCTCCVAPPASGRRRGHHRCRPPPCARCSGKGKRQARRDGGDKAAEVFHSSVSANRLRSVKHGQSVAEWSTRPDGWQPGHSGGWAARTAFRRASRFACTQRQVGTGCPHHGKPTIGIGWRQVVADLAVTVLDILLQRFEHALASQAIAQTVMRHRQIVADPAGLQPVQGGRAASKALRS